jgi:hypothetical protein
MSTLTTMQEIKEKANSIVSIIEYYEKNIAAVDVEEIIQNVSDKVEGMGLDVYDMPHQERLKKQYEEEATMMIEESERKYPKPSNRGKRFPIRRPNGSN